MCVPDCKDVQHVSARCSWSPEGSDPLKLVRDGVCLQMYVLGTELGSSPKFFVTQK